MFNWLKSYFSRSLVGADVFLYGGRSSSSGVTVNSNTVFGLPAFYRGVDLISSTVARTPCPVYRKGSNNSRSRYLDHPAHDLLNRQANPYQTSFVFKKTLVANSIWSGNGYAWIQKNERAEPVGLYLLDSNSTYPVTVYTGNAVEVYYQTIINNQQLTLSADEVIHVRSLSVDGVAGLKIVDVLREALGLGLAIQKYGAVYFRNSGGVVTTVEFPEGKGLKDQQAVETFRAGIEEKHTGLENAHRVMLLQHGAKLNRVSLNNDEAQFIESQKFNVETVANILGLPAHKLNSSVNTSYSSIEAENLALLSDCYDAHFCNIESELESKLLTENEKASGKIYIEFLRDALAAGDAASTSARIINEVNNGIRSWPEGRSILNLPTELPEGMPEWRLPVQVQAETPAEEPPPPNDTPNDPPEAEQDDEQPTPPNEQRSKALLRATLERLLDRLKKDRAVYLPRHRDIFAEALPGCDLSFLDQLGEELDSVLPEQRVSVVERLNTEQLVEEIWKKDFAA